MNRLYAGIATKNILAYLKAFEKAKRSGPYTMDELNLLAVCAVDGYNDQPSKEGK